MNISLIIYVIINQEPFTSKFMRVQFHKSYYSHYDTSKLLFLV